MERFFKFFFLQKQLKIIQFILISLSGKLSPFFIKIIREKNNKYQEKKE